MKRLAKRTLQYARNLMGTGEAARVVGESDLPNAQRRHACSKAQVRRQYREEICLIAPERPPAQEGSRTAVPDT
jgi:hypothetical protein